MRHQDDRVLIYFTQSACGPFQNQYMDSELSRCATLTSRHKQLVAVRCLSTHVSATCVLVIATLPIARGIAGTIYSGNAYSGCDYGPRCPGNRMRFKMCVIARVRVHYSRTCGLEQTTTQLCRGVYVRRNLHVS